MKFVKAPDKVHVGCLSLRVTSLSGASGVGLSPGSTQPTPTQVPQCSTSAPAVIGCGEGINSINLIPTGPIVKSLSQYIGESNDDYEGPIGWR